MVIYFDLVDVKFRLDVENIKGQSKIGEKGGKNAPLKVMTDLSV